MSEPRTPEEALAVALPKVYTQWSNLAPEWEWQAAAILAALPAGWHLTDDQHAADGLALARLQDELPDDEPHIVFVSFWVNAPSPQAVTVSVQHWAHAGVPPSHGLGSTIAEAADACREALGLPVGSTPDAI